MVRFWRTTRNQTTFHLSFLLIGLLLVSRFSCESSVDDEDDDEESMDDYETSGSINSEAAGNEDVIERPSVDVNTYRSDQKQVINSQHDDDFEETTVDSGSSSNQIFGGSDDPDSDSYSFDDDNMDSDDLNDNRVSEPPPAAQPPPNYQSPSLFTYQNNRSKLLNIIKKPGILAGIVGGAIIGILTAILLIMFIVYRMRKKDEGSYALEETKKPLNAYDYRHCPTKEFYA